MVHRIRVCVQVTVLSRSPVKHHIANRHPSSWSRQPARGLQSASCRGFRFCSCQIHMMNLRNMYFSYSARFVKIWCLRYLHDHGGLFSSAGLPLDQILFKNCFFTKYMTKIRGALLVQSKQKALQERSTFTSSHSRCKIQAEVLQAASPHDQRVPQSCKFTVATFGRSGWLAGWLTGWLARWLAGDQAGWFAG